MSKKWVCYILKSVDSNKTYIGATCDLLRRINQHNCILGRKQGAKLTRGEQWIVILFISGFPNRISCLSFESGLKHISKKKKKYKIPKSTSFISRRILNLYYYLDIGSSLGKWSSDSLTINWLEKQYKPREINFAREKIGILAVDLS